MGTYITHEDIKNGSVKVGDIVNQSLVTDSVAFEIIKVSPSGKTITLRKCRTGEVVKREDNGSPYSVVWSESIPYPDGWEVVCRANKLGQYNPLQGRPIYPANVIDGKPVTRVDYSF